ncbi:hypothetical protein D3C84_744040 [compost metagenome]
MQVQQAFFLSQSHARVRLNVRQLRDHVFPHHRIHFRRVAGMRPGFVDDLRRFRVLQPATDGGQVIHAFAAGDGCHRTTIRMAANHDVGDAQHGHRVFDRGRYTARMRAVGRHDIAGVTDHEQFTGFLLGQQFRYDTAVGTGDEQRAGVLRGGQVFEQVGPLWEGFRLELQKTVDERFHGEFPFK